MNEQHQLNILVTLDANYILPLRVLLHALVTADPSAVYTVYIAHASLTQADIARIKSGVPQERCVVCPIAVPQELLEDAPVLRRLSKATYYRLIAASYLPRTVERILYLDPDTTVLRSLQPFYTMDMQSKIIAGAAHLQGFADWVNRRRLGVKKTPQYINAGVLLMDVAKLRQLDNTELIYDFVRKNARRLLLGDQDVINELYDGEILCVDAGLYNLDEKVLRRMRQKANRDMQWVRDNTVIIHYAGSKKPWNLPYDGALGTFFFEKRRALEAQLGEAL